MFIIKFGNLYVRSMEEDGDPNLCVDTDSDTAEKTDGTTCKIKWTHEEVSSKANQQTVFMLCLCLKLT